MQKRAFYPIEDVERALKEVPRGQISERVNDLIVKGLSFEKQEEIRLAYLKFGNELASQPTNLPKNSSPAIMAAKAFETEDEEKDFI